MSYFLLVDCNNFFVSCERVFRPRLKNKAVIVLSNNDGCVIARSKEAKQLGIKMGQPVFKCRDIIARNRVVQFSSNFSLYGDMSRRVMSLIAASIAGSSAIDMETYSVDEAFIHFHMDPFSVVRAHAKLLKKHIEMFTGLPVSIGVAPTKVLAKLAVTVAKKQGGVLCIERSVEMLPHMQHLEIDAVWGIGFRLARTLRSYNVKTVADFIERPYGWIKKRMGIHGLRLLSELQGVSCSGLRQKQSPKSVLCSRSFRDAVTDRQQLLARVSQYAARAAANLRKSGGRAMMVTAFLQTNRHRDAHYYSNRCSERLMEPTCHTPTILAAVERLFEKLFKEKRQYKRAGVLLTDITPFGPFQMNLLEKRPQYDDEHTAMRLVDRLNAQVRNTVFFASALEKRKPIQRKKGNVLYSPRYTTHFSECLTIQV